MVAPQPDNNKTTSIASADAVVTCDAVVTSDAVESFYGSVDVTAWSMCTTSDDDNASNAYDNATCSPIISSISPRREDNSDDTSHTHSFSQLYDTVANRMTVSLESNQSEIIYAEVLDPIITVNDGIPLGIPIGA